MDLKQISRPMTISFWIIGHGVIEIPLGKPRPLLSILYKIVLLISYWYVILSVMDQSQFLRLAKTSNIGIQIYKVITYLNMGLTLFIIILFWIRRKDLETYFVRMNAVMQVMKRLRMKDNHWQHLKFQYIQYCVACVELMIKFVCGVWFIDGISIPTKLMIFYGFVYPSVFLYVTDIYFVICIRYIGAKFKQLNKSLSDRLKALSKIDGTDVLIEPEENICNLIKAVRHIHLELVRLSQYINQVFDLHLLISSSISVALIISFLFNTYNILVSKIFNFEVYIRIIGLIAALIFYCFKIFIIGQTCGTTSAAAQKIGGIVFKFYYFKRSREIRAEIEEFTMQLIQNPVLLTAYGFFKLDYPFVFRIAGSVTTYLIILIQMNNSESNSIKGNATISTR